MAISQLVSKSVGRATSEWFTVADGGRQYQRLEYPDGKHHKEIVNDWSRERGYVPGGLSDVVGRGN